MSTTDSVLALTAKSCVVHPLVLLSIQDHYHRVAKNTKKRVVGILLGQDLGPRGYNVANSFAVPFEEDEKDPRTWFLDHNYIEAMNEMFKKVNAREKLIGWYHTGPRLRASDLEINEVIKRFTPKPVMVIVDVRPDGERGGGGIPTDAYFAVEEIKDDGTASQKTFVHVPSSIEAEEAEEIGVEHLLRDIKNLSVGTLSSRVADQLSSLRGLSTRLGEIKDYLEQVVAGQLPINHQIVYNLQDIFNLLPNLDAAVRGGETSDGSKRPFTVATNDQLLVMYLSSLIRAVIALHDLVLNKQTAAQAAEGDEEEEGQKEEKEGEAKKDEGKKEEKSDAQKAKEWFSGDGSNEKGH
ncbi:proteasome regulatory particle lid subunit RPN8 [Rhodotorula paludigena]|uniref:proteasome regulatory particle lid subunit RPN8 n=1 Tax=Rhodotorula paludigena TaxID=86838 RepID=UPI003179060E